MQTVDLKAVDSALPALPPIPEESWRRTDPELFFLPAEEVRGMDGKPLLESGKLRAPVARISAQAGSPAAYVKEKIAGSLGETLSAWFLEADCASRTVLLHVAGQNVDVVGSEAMLGWARVSANDETALGSVFPASAIGKALTDRLLHTTGGGLRVDVSARCAVQDPIFLLVFSDEGREQDASFVSIHVERDARMSLGVVGQDSPWAHHRHDVHVGEGAHVDTAWLHGKSGIKNGQALLERRVVLKAHAEFRDVHVASSQGLVRSVSNIVFVGEGARAQSGAALAAVGHARLDYEPLQEHRVGRTSSSLKVKVLADDDAKAVFQGLIIVAKEAPHTTALQDNKNLLLGPKAKIDAMPRLEIYPDDVICKHGSATGEIDPRQLYYLTTRGFSETQARELIVNAFVADGLAPLGAEHTLASLCERVLHASSPR